MVLNIKSGYSGAGHWTSTSLIAQKIAEIKNKLQLFYFCFGQRFVCYIVLAQSSIASNGRIDRTPPQIFNSESFSRTFNLRFFIYRKISEMLTE